MLLARFLPRFRRARRELPLLAARESWSRAQVEAFQLQRINAVWRQARTQVPFYRDVAARLTLPEAFSSLEQFSQSLPIVTKETVHARPHDFLSARPAPGAWRSTGGSTGTPMRVFWSTEAHQEMLRAKYRYYDAWGVDFFDRTVFLWGHAGSLAPGWQGWWGGVLQPLEDRLRNRLRLSAYDLGRADLQRYLKQMAAFRPAALYGYSSAVGLLAEEAAAAGWSQDSLKLITLTGEPAPAELLARVEEVFHAPATLEYGSTECGIIAYQWPDRTLRVREDMTLVETVPAGPGRYEVVVSVLDNPSFPLLRYNMADVVAAPLEKPDRGFAILQPISGRQNDFVISRTGRYIHSARFDALFKYQTPPVRRYQVRQQGDGSLVALLEVDAAPADYDCRAMAAQLQEIVEGYPARVDILPTLPAQGAGKHRLVISELAVSRRAAAPLPAGSSRGAGCQVGKPTPG